MSNRRRLKAIIVDDEPDGREVLSMLLAVHQDTIEIVGQAGTIMEAKKCIDEMKPDLAFLDINMRSENIFDLLAQYEKIDFEIIFVTSYDQYMLPAIKFSALDYLLKPVEFDELSKAVRKAESRIGFTRDYQSLIKNLTDGFSGGLTTKRIAVHTTDSVKFISPADIIHLVADSNYTKLATLSGERLLVPKLLREFEELFGLQSEFVRINRSTIINVRSIEKYTKGFPCMVTMTDGETFEVSRRRKPDIVQRMESLKIK